MKVICIGEIVFDTFLEVPSKKIKKDKDREFICYPFGEKVEVANLSHSLGGSACNVAVGLKRLENEVSLVSNLGKDILAKEVMSLLRAEDISLAQIQYCVDCEVENSFVLQGPGGERTILVHRGESKLTQTDISLDLARSSQWIYLGPLPDKTLSIFEKIKALKEKTDIGLALNLGARQLAWKKSQLLPFIETADILFQNKEEAEKLVSEEKDIKDLLASLKKLGSDVVVITDGAEGAYSYDGISYFHGPSTASEIVDATGAGDAFSSGFLAGYIADREIKSALKYGLLNSGAVLGSVGGQTGLLTAEEMKEKAEKEIEIKIL
jgi:fructokinase